MEQIVGENEQLYQKNNLLRHPENFKILKFKATKEMIEKFPLFFKKSLADPLIKKQNMTCKNYLTRQQYSKARSKQSAKLRNGSQVRPIIFPTDVSTATSSQKQFLTANKPKLSRGYLNVFLRKLAGRYAMPNNNNNKHNTENKTCKSYEKPHLTQINTVPEIVCKDLYEKLFCLPSSRMKKTNKLVSITRNSQTTKAKQWKIRSLNTYGDSRKATELYASNSKVNINANQDVQYYDSGMPKMSLKRYNKKQYLDISNDIYIPTSYTSNNSVQFQYLSQAKTSIPGKHKVFKQ